MLFDPFTGRDIWVGLEDLPHGVVFRYLGAFVELQKTKPPSLRSSGSILWFMPIAGKMSIT